jgi:hypothetical protein
MSDLILRGNFLVFLRYKVLSLVILSVFTSFVFAQGAKDNKLKNPDKNAPVQALTPEQVAESVVLIYGTRDNLKQIRKTTIENGKMSVFNADGTTDNVIYARRTLRGDNLFKEKVRLDQKFPSAEFTLIYSTEKVIGIFNDAVFTPKKETTEAFQNQMFQSLEALLRYKENEAKLELLPKTKQLGVEYYVLNVTDKDNRKTTFFVSTKLLRVMSLEYTYNSVKYTRKFHNYNYAQQTLVPFRTTLYANDKLVEESTVSTITFGQKIEDGYFETN